MPFKDAEVRRRYFRELMRRRRAAGKSAQPKPAAAAEQEVILTKAQAEGISGAWGRTKTHLEQLSAAFERERARVQELEAELKRERTRSKMFEEGLQASRRQRRAESKPKAEKPPLPPDEERERIIKSLKTRVRNLTGELHAMRDLNTKLALKNGMMNFQTMGVIASVLHPDRRPSEAEREHACKLALCEVVHVTPPRACGIAQVRTAHRLRHLAHFPRHLTQPGRGPAQGPLTRRAQPAPGAAQKRKGQPMVAIVQGRLRQP